MPDSPDAFDPTQAAGRTESQVDLQEGYEKLHEADDYEAYDCVLLEVADADARERWAAARRRSHGPRAKPGYAMGTARALKAAQGCTVVCMKEGCGALVHLQAARRQARAAARTIFVSGDGCASKSCSGGHVQPGRFARRQVQMAKALLDGSRTLVLWPALTESRTNMWIAPCTLTHAKAREVIERTKCV